MDVTPQLLHDVEFREAKRGGYNTQDVDEFLERLAVGLERQEAILHEARQRVEVAEDRIAEAERRAAEAADRASQTSDADETLKRTLVLAQRTADAAIKEAEEEAARTLAAAQDQAARLLADAQEATARARAEADAEARRAQEDARSRVLAELLELEAARDQLHGDVDILERHLSEQRDRLRLTTRELQRLLDDPATLREVSLPVLSDVAVPSTAVPSSAVPSTAVPEVGVPEPAPGADPVGAPSLADDQTGWPAEQASVEPIEAVPPPPPSLAYAEVDEEEPVELDLSTEPAGAPAEDTDGDDDDAYLAELRKAMTDESPLGPREEGDIGSRFDQGSEAPRSRFGRRR